MAEEVSNTEVKKCFVVSTRAKGLAGFDKQHFQACLQEIEHKVSNLNYAELDLEIDWPPRRDMLNSKSLRWIFGKCSIDEIGVWVNHEGSGGLPREWCAGSVRDTVQALNENSSRKFSGRASYAISGIKNIAETLVEHRMLSIIVVVSGLWYQRRRAPCKSVKYDIDDGCMRAIALAQCDQEYINAFIGMMKG
jgi:hypothetical protein